MDKGAQSVLSALGDAKPKKTLLIVEDDFWTRYTAAEFFRNMGYEVLEAKDAGEAVSVLSSGKPVDVVFSDIQMPGSMNGIDLARWITQRYPTLPVLLTSGRRPADLPVISPYVFFAKPYSLSDVEMQIRWKL
jgi:CheY-like chemotaxis protein